MKIMIAGISLLLTTLGTEPVENRKVEVAEAVIATEVVDRTPTGVSQSFPTGIGQVYCFTRITGETGGTVDHVWYHEDQEMARVTLQIGGTNWRTWSTKRIVPEWTGNWRVDIQGSDGAVLQSISFTVQ